MAADMTNRDIWERFEAIEECYEFMLAYAAQGLPSDEGSESGRQVREFLNRAVEALSGLAESCAAAATQGRPIRGVPLCVWTAMRATRLPPWNWSLAQPAISSQLIDNLNASVHLRALLTDVFLLGEVFRIERATALNAFS